MRIKNRKEKAYGSYPGKMIFFTGFLIGTMLPGIIRKGRWGQDTAGIFYLLEAFAKKDNNTGKEYLVQVLQMRGIPFLVYSLCGASLFGAPLAVLAMLVEGIRIGAVLTMSILHFGFSGGAAGLALFLPQELLYLPVLVFFLGQVYENSSEFWAGRGGLPANGSRYVVNLFLCAFIYFVGILLEVYLNPWIVKKIINLLDYF